MPPLFFDHEVVALINELGAPLPAPLRPRFLERVRRLLRDDATPTPARVVEVCAAAQRELMLGGCVDVGDER